MHLYSKNNTDKIEDKIDFCVERLPPLHHSLLFLSLHLELIMHYLTWLKNVKFYLVLVTVKSI